MHNSLNRYGTLRPLGLEKLMRRREFISVIGGAGVTWPLAVHAQQPSIPVVAFVSGRSAESSVRVLAAFRKGLDETGYVEGQNVTVEYHWLEGQYDRLSALLADLVHRQVAVIASPGSAPAVLAAKAAQRRSQSSSASA